MEDLLDLYAEPYDPKRPVVCFDETSTQLLAETRAPMPPRPGRPQRLLKNFTPAHLPDTRQATRRNQADQTRQEETSQAEAQR